MNKLKGIDSFDTSREYCSYLKQRVNADVSLSENMKGIMNIVIDKSFIETSTFSAKGGSQMFD